MKEVVDVDDGDPHLQITQSCKNFSQWTPDTKRCLQGSSIWMKYTDLNVRPSSWGPRPS